MADQSYSACNTTINAITTGTITSGQLTSLQSIATSAMKALLALEQVGTGKLGPDVDALVTAARNAAINTFGGNVTG